MVHPFDEIPGVIEVTSGYTGGTTVNPTYEQVCSGTTGHCEAVQITFEAHQVSYGALLERFWQQIDPTDSGGQFYDRGSSYRPAIFYHNAAQKRQAEESKVLLDGSGRFPAPITVDILPAGPFYVAEDYHQGFYRTHSEHYQRYRRASGRDLFLARFWGTQP